MQQQEGLPALLKFIRKGYNFAVILFCVTNLHLSGIAPASILKAFLIEDYKK